MPREFVPVLQAVCCLLTHLPVCCLHVLNISPFLLSSPICHLPYENSVADFFLKFTLHACSWSKASAYTCLFKGACNHEHVISSAGLTPPAPRPYLEWICFHVGECRPQASHMFTSSGGYVRYIHGCESVRVLDKYSGLGCIWTRFTAWLHLSTWLNLLCRCLNLLNSRHSRNRSTLHSGWRDFFFLYWPMGRPLCLTCEVT